MKARERFLAAARSAEIDRPPVWMMRQAGRYLPEYREIRGSHTFTEMYRSPEIAAEVTLQPIRRFGMDAAVIFSDILVVPEALGVSVQFEEGHGPRLNPQIRSASDLDRLTSDPPRIDFTCDALQRVRMALGDEHALIGFAGAPFTLATYMIEGGSSRDLINTKRLFTSDPGLMKDLLQRLSGAVTGFLLEQIAAGADAVQLFDTWAGLLSPADYAEFALPYARDVISRLAGSGAPVIYYANGIAGILHMAATTGADVIGIDWRMELAEARRRCGDSIALQGNLDPVLLFAPPDRIRREVQRVRASLNGATGGHIFNLGHGILPTTPLEGAAAFVKAVQELR